MTLDERYQACLAKLTPAQLIADRMLWKMDLLLRFYKEGKGDLDTTNEHEFQRWHRARLFAEEDQKS